MPRRPHRRRWLRLSALAAAILWLVSITAVSRSAKNAFHALGQEADLALTILRLHLGDIPRADSLPAAVALALAQSPALLSAREAVLELRRGEETDTDEPDPPSPPVTEHTPVTEKAQTPETPLIIIDNGVPARTLVPSSPKGYVVAGDVYIDNRSDKAFDSSLFDGSFDAHLHTGSEPQILIVHTHGSEAYTMPAGYEYTPSAECRTTDMNCNMVRVGQEIAETLRAAGLSVLHDTTLHDYPRYSGAYTRSLATVEEYLARYPSIALVLDVHRDAISDSDGNMYKVVSSAVGLNAAQMAFVIGTDGGGLHHPQWQENLKLAAAIQQTICADYPTLMRPIAVRNSRYNQHTTTGSLLIEMGAAGNSLDEALLSARLLAAAIIETMMPSMPKPLPAPDIN